MKKPTKNEIKKAASILGRKGGMISARDPKEMSRRGKLGMKKRWNKK